ncbi:hypothetical protein [Streptomyces durhamensis]|uniref:hypothetical protein n=1 Tax=Streptomyces durhamensis TaxID=68194 RepID=UPI0004CCA300|nr:hypothetical protein [Streptomyces durhamensis]
MSIAAWLHLDAEALESKAAASVWAEFRERLYTDPMLNIRRGDTLRARKLAAGQGRPRTTSARRGPNRAERWGYQYVLRRGLEVIAGLPGTTVGTAQAPGTTATATAEALLAQLSRQHRAQGTSAFAVVRTNTAAPAWYDLTPTPDRAPCATDGPESLLEAAEFVAYCAYQHHARRHSRRFLWQWLPELLSDAEGPLAL